MGSREMDFLLYNECQGKVVALICCVVIFGKVWGFRDGECKRSG